MPPRSGLTSSAAAGGDERSRAPYRHRSRSLRPHVVGARDPCYARDMGTLRIDTTGWPPEWVDMVRTYATGLSGRLAGNGLKPSGIPKDELPDWPGSASVPPERLRREELYKDEE